MYLHRRHREAVAAPQLLSTCNDAAAGEADDAATYYYYCFQDVVDAVPFRVVETNTDRDGEVLEVLISRNFQGSLPTEDHILHDVEAADVAQQPLHESAEDAVRLANLVEDRTEEDRDYMVAEVAGHSNRAVPLLVLSVRRPFPI